MISSVCQGLQSHIESHVLSFHLFPQEPTFSTASSATAHEEEQASTICIARNRDEDYSVRRNRAYTENGEGWSFLEALSNGNGTRGSGKEDDVYVHPLVKRSSSKLSMKSLEMCTESLCSESGSDMGENDMSLFTSEASDSGSNWRGTTWVSKKATRRDTSFPPPLTSISGSSGFRVESHREDGRLVLRAVAVSACGSRYFHAERSQGRLRLQLVKDIKEDEEDDEGEGCSGEMEEEAYWGNEEAKENDGKDEEERGMENFGRPCRCKEGRRESIELLNWEPLWIST